MPKRTSSLMAAMHVIRVCLLQVRFGVLNAGNFGVSQSRKRTFIWGVAPGSALPEWPRPQHVFRSPQLTIKLPGGAEVRPSHQQQCLLKTTAPAPAAQSLAA